MPTRNELIAYHRSDDEICRAIGADALVYQGIDAMKSDVQSFNSQITGLEASCFDGNYITGDVSAELLDRLEATRRQQAEAA